MPYDILWNQSTYTTLCLLLETWHLTDNCIKVCGNWIFHSNLKVALPLTQVCLNYTCCCYDTDKNKFIGVSHAIRAVPPEVVQRILNMKLELLIIIIIGIITIYIVVIFIFHIFIMVKILSCFNFIQYDLMIVFR